MKFKKFIVVSIIAVMMPCLVWATKLTVTVNDANGNPISGADVAAINFGPNGPDGEKSALDKTNSSGQCELTLTENLTYQVFATKSGYVPSVRDQMFDFNNPPILTTSVDQTKVIILRQATSADGVRDLKVTVTHDATEGNLIFLHVMNKSSYEPAGFGVVKSTGVGNVDGYVHSLLTINEDYAYELDAFDPLKQRGNRRAITHKAGETINEITPELNISDAGDAMAPPTKQIITDEKMGDIVFEGRVVTEGEEINLENVNVMVHGSNPLFQEIQTQTDENGYFAIYESGDVENPIFIGGDEYFLDFMKQGRVGTFKNIMYKGIKSTMTVTMAPATGKIKGIVTINEVPVPQAWVNAHPDWNDYSGMNDRNPGIGHGEDQTVGGAFEIIGLPSGRYNLEVWSEFNNQPVHYNWGTDGNPGNPEDWGDDYIVEIDTATNNYAKVLNAADKKVYLSAEENIIINITTEVSGGNSITGTVTFTGADAPDPNSVIIVARQRFTGEGEMPESGFTVLKTEDNVSDNVYNYSITGLADGTYEARIKAPNFGMKPEGEGERLNENITLSADGKNTAVVNFTMAPAGIIEGTLRTPKGTIFRPNFGMNFIGAHVNANSWETGVWEGAEVNKNGIFKIEGLIPGTYVLKVNGHGMNYTYATARMENIKVEALQTTMVEIPLKEGVRVHPVLSQDLPESILTQVNEHKLYLSIVYTPANIVLSAKNLDEYLGVGDDVPSIHYWEGDFEPISLEPGAYNFYATLETSFPMNYDNQCKTIIGRAMKVIIDKSKETDDYKSKWNPDTLKVQNIPMTMSIGDSSFSGTYAGKNTFRSADMEVIDENFSKFLNYVPKVTLINSDGNILGIGMCTPDADTVGEMDKQGGPETIDPDDPANESLMDNMGFAIHFLIPQEGVKAVVTTPNYPPLVKVVKIPGTMNVNMDNDVGAGANITGVIYDTAQQAIANATIRIRGRLLDRTVKSGSDGTYLIPGLATGVYRLLVSAGGYALDAEKVVIYNQDKKVNFILTACAGSITGKVYSQKFPYPLVVPGAKLVAYDDTANGLNPEKEIAIYEVITDNNGIYKIAPLIEGHTYKVALVVPGKAVQVYSPSPQIPSESGSTVENIDFTYKSMPPKIKIVARPDSEGSSVILECESPKKLVSLTAKYNAEATEYEDSTAVDLTITEVGEKAYSTTLPDKTKHSIVRFKTNDGAKTENIDFIYDPNNLAQTIENIDQKAVASGEVFLDSQGSDTSGLYISPGSITLAEGSIPEIVIEKENRDTSVYADSMPQDSIGGDVYHINLTMDGSQQNDKKTMTLNIGYDPNLVGEDTEYLSVHQYNEDTQKWEPVLCAPMVDPISGIVSVEINSISDATSANAALTRRATCATFNGKEYVLNKSFAAVTSDQKGIFIVSQTPARMEYTGSELKVFNVPNPFNLKTKTVTLNRGGSIPQITTEGTIIRFAVPPGLGRNIKTRFRIYNIAAEMVRELNANDLLPGSIDEGFYYYLPWDGKNKDGDKCASGVYFCVSEIGNKTKVIKMALIK